MRSLAILVAALVLVALSVVFAAVPGAIQYQGRLTSDVGEPLSGTYTLTFAIYTAPDQGDQKWSETHTDVVVEQGLFSIMLGSLVPIPDSVFNFPERYLEIRVNGEALLPRTRITAVGYAKTVGTIDGAVGGTISDSLVLVPSFSSLNGRLPAGTNATTTKIVLGFGQLGTASMTFYEPVDSKTAGTEDPKAIKIDGNSIVMYGETGQDTVLIIYPNGDIISKGQITMGENSSPGNHTTVLGFNNTGVGDTSTIGGGSYNTTNGVISVIAGGHDNQADGEGAVISGGKQNHATGNYATISGGLDNTAAGDYGTVPGGQSNSAGGTSSYAAGHRAKAATLGSFVWADQTEEDFTSTADNQFIIRANGGVGIGTNAPHGVFEIVGPDMDSSVNLPQNAVSSPEILDEPGMAENWSTSDVLLTQGSTQVEPLVSVTVNLPAPGYVVARGSGTLEIYGTSQRNQAYIQVSEAPGGGGLGPFNRLAGTGDNDAQTRRHYFDMSVERVFYLTAGEHTLIFEGMAHPMNGSAAITNIQHPQLSAIYYPTSYGQVVGFVNAQQAGNFDEVILSTWSRSVDSLGTTATQPYYQVNLNELEIKVQQARRQLENAEAELRSAQQRQSSGN